MRSIPMMGKLLEHIEHSGFMGLFGLRWEYYVRQIVALVFSVLFVMVSTTCIGAEVLGTAHPNPTPACLEALKHHITRLQSGDNDFGPFIRDLEPIAAAGDPVAKFLLGAVLAEANPKESIKLLRESAMEGCIGSAGILGEILIPEKPLEARTWLTMAANGGDEMSRIFLAVHYLTGDSQTPKNMAEALAWARLAKRQGSPNLSFLAEQLISRIQPMLSREEGAQADMIFTKLLASHPKRPDYLCGQSTP